MTRAIAILFLFSASATLKAQSVKILARENIFDTSRFENCHASTLVEIQPNQFICAWFAGKQEGSVDTGIWSATSQDGKWSEPRLIAEGIQANGPRYACWNPVLFKSAAGKLFLFYKVGPNPREWWGLYKTSGDSGRSWSEAVKLPAGFLGPIKNKPLQLLNGSILYPSSVENANGRWQIRMEISDGDGKNWRGVPVEANGFDAIQPTILLHSDNRIQLLCRSKQNEIVEAWSSDLGQTWTPLTAVRLPNPNSGIDAVSLKENSLKLLVYNPTVSGNNWSEGRSVLKIAVSKDGLQWTDIYTLEEHDEGEYSYPAVIQDSEGIIHLSYTNRRKTISHVALRID